MIGDANTVDSQVWKTKRRSLWENKKGNRKKKRERNSLVMCSHIDKRITLLR